MTAISYFQRYSQKENHVTNNTLLMLRHLYRYSPAKFNELINALFEQEYSIGLQFTQQEPGSHSIPDAVISQAPFRIFIETKLGGALNNDQIKNHIETINNKGALNGASILIGLTKTRVSPHVYSELSAYAKTAGVQFINFTYTDLVAELGKLCSDYEQELLEIIKDYRVFLAAEELLSNAFKSMIVFPCGTSWRENVRYGIYYEPATRRAKLDCRFLGKL